MQARFKTQSTVNSPNNTLDEEVLLQKKSAKLPKIKLQHLNEDQVNVIGLKVLNKKRMHFDPIGCSRSMILQKTLLKKKISKRTVTESNKEEIESRHVTPQKKDFFDSYRIRKMVSPEKYISKIYL